MIPLQQAARLNPQQRVQFMERVEAAIQSNPRNLDALLSGASLNQTGGNLSAALEYLKKALKLKKEDVELLLWIGKLALDLRDFPLAKTCSKRATDLRPQDPRCWHLRAEVLDGAGDPETAITAFEKTISIAGENAELIFQIGNCHTYLGNNQRAEACYRRALDLEPTHALALYSLSSVHKFDGEDLEKYIAAVEKAVSANNNKPDFYTSGLYFGAGKAFEDNREYDRAFEYYKKANDFRRPKNEPDIARNFDRNKETFTVEFLEERRSWGVNAHRPIFIIGMPRSGTTLVDSIISAHSKITSGGELPLIEDMLFRRGLLNAERGEFAEAMQSLEIRDVKAMAKGYAEGAKAFVDYATRFTDKMPHNFMNIGLIQLIFPQAKFIHCRRHPLDTCASIYTHGMTPAHNYYKTDLARLGRYYRLYEDIMAYWRAILPNQILDVRYEVLVTNFEQSCKNLIDFLDLKWEDSVLDRNLGKSAVKTLSAGQVRQPVYQTGMGK